MRCAARGCRGLCTSKNTLGVGDRCRSGESFDPLDIDGHTIHSRWDLMAEDDLTADELFEMREAPE